MFAPVGKQARRAIELHAKVAQCILLAPARTQHTPPFHSKARALGIYLTMSTPGTRSASAAAASCTMSSTEGDCSSAMSGGMPPRVPQMQSWLSALEVFAELQSASESTARACTATAGDARSAGMPQWLRLQHLSANNICLSTFVLFVSFVFCLSIPAHADHSASALAAPSGTSADGDARSATRRGIQPAAVIASFFSSFKLRSASVHPRLPAGLQQYLAALIAASATTRLKRDAWRNH